MADIAQRVLMNEFKQLSKEKWTNIEVSRVLHTLREGVEAYSMKEHPANHLAARQRERLRVERSTHRPKRGLPLLWRLLQGSDELSPQLPP